MHILFNALIDLSVSHSPRSKRYGRPPTFKRTKSANNVLLILGSRPIKSLNLLPPDVRF